MTVRANERWYAEEARALAFGIAQARPMVSGVGTAADEARASSPFVLPSRRTLHQLCGGGSCSRSVATPSLTSENGIG